MFNYEGIRKDKSSNTIRYIGYIFSAIVVFILVFFIRVQFFTQYEDIFRGECEDYSQGWEFVTEKGIVSGSMPISLGTDRGKMVEARNTLPLDVEDRTYMCILTNISMKIYVDDELRLTFDRGDNPVPGGYVKSHYILMQLSREDRGKEIRIVRDGDSYNGDFNAMYIGDKQGISQHFYSEDGLQFFMAALLGVFSIVTIIVGFLMLSIYKVKMPIILLGYGMLLGSLWFIFDSFIFQILFGNYFVDGPIEYMLMMTFPYFFVRYLNYEQKRRYEKIYTLICAILAFNFISESFIHFTNAASYQDNLLFIDIGVGIAIITMIGTIIVDIIRGYFKDYFLVGLGFILMIVFSVAQIIVMLLIKDNHGALLLLLSLYNMLFLASIHMMRKVGAIQQQATYAKHANELKSSFLANMSHEIRTPVNAIMGMNEMILRESSEAQIRKYSDDVKHASANLLDIINDILDFSKIESGRMDINEGNYQLGNLLRDVSKLIEVKAKSKEIEFRLNASKELPNMLKGDEVRIRQVILNVLNNAVKYTDEGNVNLNISVTKIDSEIEKKLTVVGKDIILHIEVEDTGIGIKEEDMSKLFDIFERLDLKKNRTIEGTGLGLAITKNLIDLMGGTIAVDSIYGEGSKFIIDIPQGIWGREKLGDAWNDNKEVSVVSEYKKTFVAPMAKILVVDDIKVNITVIKGLLKKTKIQVEEALSGAECIEKYENSHYDLILMDHMMPQMDGIETLHEMKRRFGDLCPVIALTANAIDGMREMYLSEGFMDYISKPVSPEELEEMMRSYLPKGKIEIL